VGTGGTERHDLRTGGRCDLAHRRRRDAQRLPHPGVAAAVGAAHPPARAVRVVDADQRAGDSYSTATQPYFSLEIWDGTGYRQFGNQAPNQDVENLRHALLWIFPDANTVQIGPALAWHGSVLAPGAAFVFPGSTQLNGTIIAAPEPIPTPAPTPGPEPVPPPLDTEEPPSQGGVLPGADASTNLDVTKKVLSRRGRAVELFQRRPGQLVRFRLRAINFGFASATDVRACDRVPRGLRLVRAPGDPTLRRGRLCWRVATIDTRRQAIATFRVRRRVCGRIVNRVVIGSDNGGRDDDSAHVSACRRVLPRQTG
jgi:uncharacterized repeat protein (TIGR01451 family)